MEIETPMPYRVAVYAAPDPASDWWAHGSTWLGRCAAGHACGARPAIEGVDAATMERLLADPRRYGWHATLKAPWRLAGGVDLARLHAALEAICHHHAPLDLPELRVTRLGSFLALQPAQPLPALHALADDCVRRLQALAAPLSEDELAKRRRGGLDAHEDALLRAWGYPWVLDRFRFHFSLTGPLDGLSEAQVAAIEDAAVRHFGALGPLRLDRLSVFIEPARGADFVLFDQQELGA